MENQTLRAVTIVLNILLLGGASVLAATEGLPRNNYLFLLLLMFLAPAASLAVIFKRL